MKMIKVTLLVSTLLVLSGCMVVPVSPGAHGYYAPGYYGPSIGVGIYGGDGARRGDYGRSEGRGYGRGHGRD